MPLFLWKEDMSVGVAALDEEHKQIIDIINQLYESVLEGGAGLPGLDDVYKKLVGYIDTHLEHEELLFEQTDYPEAEVHVHEHERLAKRVIKAIQDHESGGKDSSPMDLMIFLSDWLRSHVMICDKKYTAHFNAHGIF